MRKNEIKWIIPILVLMGVVFITKIAWYNEGQKDALRGKQKYKMEVRWTNTARDSVFSDCPCDDWVDSLIVSRIYMWSPVDTVFIKK